MAALAIKVKLVSRREHLRNSKTGEKKMRGQNKLSLHQEIGHKWETEAFDLLTALGYHVEWCGDWTDHFDLLVNGRKVEVKAAYPTIRDNGSGYKSTRYQFNLSAKVDVGEEWFLVAVAIDEQENENWFFVPGDKISTATMSLTSHPARYNGKWSVYKNDVDSLKRFVEGN
jgi:hypothetical protein